MMRIFEIVTMLPDLLKQRMIDARRTQEAFQRGLNDLGVVEAERLGIEGIKAHIGQRPPFVRKL